MGPNLRQMLDRAKSDRLTKENWNAFIRQSDIFERHGEALIEALEELVKLNEGSFGGESERWEQLLAQLESEAQP